MFFTVKAWEMSSKPYFSVAEMGTFKEGCLFPLAIWIQLSISFTMKYVLFYLLKYRINFSLP